MDTYAIHLRSIFAHIDTYVDRWRLQYEGGDAPKHVVELGLVLVPNEDLCRLLFTCLKSCCHGLEAIGLKTVDLTIRDGGCLNKLSIDIETLERERRSREEIFCSLSSILSSKMRGGSNLDASEDECKKRKWGLFGSGNTMSKGANALRADLKRSEETILDLNRENEELRRLLKSHITCSNKINQPWLQDLDFNSPGYDLKNPDFNVSESNRKKKSRHLAMILNVIHNVS